MSYKSFFAAYNASVKAGNPLTRQEIISDFTGGRTDSLKELSPKEYNDLVKSLNAPHSVTLSLSKGKPDRMRKALISIFHKMDYGKDAARAAKAWSEKQGVRGIKKTFNSYTTNELKTLIIVAEKMLSDYQAAIRKRIATI